MVKTPEHAHTVEDLISLLEYCINQSKDSGKNKVIYSDANIISKLKRKSHIAEAIKEAVSNGSFVVYYQPVYSVKSNRLTSAEALLRFFDKELGPVSPTEFIPIAEETGAINSIFYFVLDQVCQFIRQLDRSGIEVDAISVNCSAMQIFEENLVENVLGIIQTHQVDPGKIRLEITESVFIDKIDDVIDIMNALKAHGIAFYLDDFGTGYSNLATVMKLPFEYIKIDKSLLYEANQSSKSFGIIKSLSSTFSDNGMKVVIEGVESPGHKDIVDKINADYIQGYLYATPMTDTETIAHYRKAIS